MSTGVFKDKKKMYWKGTYAALAEQDLKIVVCPHTSPPTPAKLCCRLHIAPLVVRAVGLTEGEDASEKTYVKSNVL